MIAAIRSEFRKMLSIRSTWVLIALSFLIAVGLMGFWIYGYKDVTRAATNPGLLMDYLLTAIAVTGTFLSFLAVLSVGHEYRYSTIMYSLTSVRHRGQVFLAKWLTVTVVAFLAGILIIACGVGAMNLGLSVTGTDAAAQRIEVWEVIWRSALYLFGSISFALFITLILRSLIGAIAVILILPSTFEPLLTLVLKENTKYLPYTSLGKLVENNPQVATTTLVMTAVYITVFGVVAYVLFRKRDAN